MKNYTKTKIFTISLCLIVIAVALFVQLENQDSVKGCSYLDPITIDALAFFVAIFLVIEGIYRISEHKNMLIRNQLTRSIRIAIGCAILTIHIMQVIYK